MTEEPSLFMKLNQPVSLTGVKNPRAKVATSAPTSVNKVR